MGEIVAGSMRQERVLVTPDRAIDFLGVESARVLSTPHLVGLLEMVCRNLLVSFLPSGQDSVGTHVDLRHLAATPIGMQVTLRAEIISVDGRRVRFRIEARDEQEKIAEGTHERFVMDIERFASRMETKAKRCSP